MATLLDELYDEYGRSSKLMEENDRLRASLIAVSDALGNTIANCDEEYVEFYYKILKSARELIAEGADE